MDELFRFALTRAADPTEAATIPLERRSKFQSNPPDPGPAGLENIAAKSLDYSAKWEAFEAAALRYVLDPSVMTFIESPDLTEFAQAGTLFLKQLKKEHHDKWAADTRAFVDRYQGQGAKLGELDTGLADVFLSLTILRCGGPTHVHGVIQRKHLSPIQGELILHKPSLEELAELLRIVHLVRLTIASPPQSAAEINAILHATLLLPPKVFASFEKPVHPVGVTDLLLVKQHVLRYELGEIARIENILRGELRDHTQKHTLSNERDTFVQTDKETQTDQELTNTDHVSLRSEIASTLSEDTKVDAGLHAQYTGVVNIQADLTAAYNRSSTEAKKSATEMAKDVTQRAAKKVTERIQQSETTKVIETFEETEEQKFENKDSNVSGVYQWVEKVYLAQVFNYGKHLIFDLMVPEPASSVLQADSKPLTPPPTEPDPFDLDPLAISYLPGPGYYGTYVAKYNAIGVSPAPTDSMVVASAKSFPYQDDQFIAASEVIAIDDGYEAYAANVVIDYLTNDDAHHNAHNAGGQQICFVDVTLGTGTVVHAEAVFDGNTPRRGSKSEAVPFNPVKEHSIPLSIITDDIDELSVNVEVLCRPTATKIAKWQLETHQAIAGAWQKLQDEYNAKLEAAKLEQQRIGILGESPAETNRQMEQTELKRSCIAILDNRKVIGYNEVEVTPPNTLTTPRLSAPTFFDDGAWVRWFEQAFEWDKMSYVFYPYFWGRNTEWENRLKRRYDSDPLFENFLRAGYARVVIPVRNSFRKAVNFYLATGRPWMGGDLPSVGDRTYLPISEEIKEQSGAPGQEKPVGDPWEIRLPTRLIKLRQDDKLPPDWEWLGHDNKVPVGSWTWRGDTEG